MDLATAKRMVRTLAVFHFLFAVLFLLIAGFIFYALPGLSGSGRDLSVLGARGVVVGVLSLLLAALYVIGGIGVWRFRPWGRILAIILFAVSVVGGLALGVLNLVNGSTSLAIQAFLDAAIAGFFLWLFGFQKDIVKLFRQASRK